MFILQMGVSWPTLKHVDGVQVPNKNVDSWNKTVGQQKVEQVMQLNACERTKTECTILVVGKEN